MVIMLTMRNPCPTSKLTASTELEIGNLLYVLGSEAIEVGLVASQLVELNTQVDCGLLGLVYFDQATEAPMSASFIETVAELNDDQVTEFKFKILQQTDNSSIGTYTVQVVVFLEDYPDVAAVALEAPFTVSIE